MRGAVIDAGSVGPLLDEAALLAELLEQCTAGVHPLVIDTVISSIHLRRI